MILVTIKGNFSSLSYKQGLALSRLIDCTSGKIEVRE